MTSQSRLFFRPQPTLTPFDRESERSPERLDIVLKVSSHSPLSIEYGLDERTPDPPIAALPLHRDRLDVSSALPRCEQDRADDAPVRLRHQRVTLVDPIVDPPVIDRQHRSVEQAQDGDPVVVLGCTNQYVPGHGSNGTLIRP